MLWLLLGIVPILSVYSYIQYQRLKFGICRCSRHLVGKTVIVTGSNTGCGYENARDFAERGARVILACRNEAKGIQARDAIIESTENKDVFYYKLDLSSFKSIREFVDKFKANENRLDILVNNAGDLDLDLTKTEDGLLLSMQVNYFGPFLLTNLLLPMLKSNAPSRIVNVASSAYILGKLKLDNLNDATLGVYGKMGLYGSAKLCFILMTLELSRQLEGAGVTVNCLCPGFVNTNILQKVRNPFWRFVLSNKAKLLSKNHVEGAQTQIYLSVSPEVKDVSGYYFVDCKQETLKDFASDPVMAKKLWEISERLVKLQ